MEQQNEIIDENDMNTIFFSDQSTLRPLRPNVKVIFVSFQSDIGTAPLTVPFSSSLSSFTYQELPSLFSTLFNLTSGLRLKKKKNGEAILLGFDAVTNRWAFELKLERGDGRLDFDYSWVPEASLPE